MATYSASSPYFKTPLNGFYMDVMTNRPITAEQDDVEYTIDLVYNNRPDLLASDLYRDPNLWWVFAKRNPDTLKDPLFDFKTGITIRLPKLVNLKSDLGL